MKKTYIDHVYMSGSNACLIKNLPMGVSLDLVSKIFDDNPIDVKKFGFWNDSSPNFNSYVPNLDPKELEEGLTIIQPVYRALSEIIVRKSVDPIDFSVNEVLKESMWMLEGQTVYPNHEVLTGNELGVIVDAAWQDKYKEKGGITIPGGINTRLKIDGSANPKIAKGINMEPPSVHSVSVGVEFAWEKSHPTMTDEEFSRKRGTLHDDGKLVRRVVTKVRRYYEISLVPHGADPYAKLVKNGRIVQPKHANEIYNFTEYSPSSSVQMISFKTDIATLSETNPINLPKEKDDMKNLRAIATFLAIKLTGETTDEELSDLIDVQLKDIKAKADSVEQLTTDKTTAETKVTELTEKITGLTTEVTGLKDDAAAGKIFVEALRSDAKAAYTKLKDGKVEASIVKLLDEGDVVTVKALAETYQADLEAKFPGTCTDCGSHNVSRKLSESSEDPIPGKVKTTGLTAKEIEKQFRQKQNQKGLGVQK